MVQLQTFATSDYLLPTIVLIIISFKIERNFFFKLFNSFVISNNSLDVLLLDKINLQFKKGRNGLTHTLGC